MGQGVVQHAFKPRRNIDVRGPSGGMQRLKEAQPLNVVCMYVRNEEVARSAFRQVLPAHPQPGARVKNKQKTAIGAQLDAGGVAAIKRHAVALGAASRSKLADDSQRGGKSYCFFCRVAGSVVREPFH